jgi:hypothetical protein
MTLHFTKRDEEYFAYSYLGTEDGDDDGQHQQRLFFLAINHRFHDLASLGLLFRGEVWSSRNLLPEGVQKAIPSEFRGFQPTKLSTLRLPREVVETLSKRYQISHNALLFWISSSLVTSQVSTLSSPSKIMCLHSLRKGRGQSLIAGGDYTCLVNPLTLPPPPSHSLISTNPLLQELLPLVNDYFMEMRGSHNLLTDPSKPLPDPLWVFDTWVGPRVGAPLVAHPDFVLDDMRLMNLYSMVVHNFIIAIDYPDSFHLHLFSDDKEFSSDEIVEELRRHAME